MAICWRYPFTLPNIPTSPQNFANTSGIILWYDHRLWRMNSTWSCCFQYSMLWHLTVWWWPLEENKSWDEKTCCGLTLSRLLCYVFYDWATSDQHQQQATMTLVLSAVISNKQPPPVPIHPSNIYDSLTHNITMYEIRGLDPSCLILNIIRKWCLDSWPHFKVCISYLDIHCCPCPSHHRGCCQRSRVLAAREGGGCQHWPAAQLLSPAIGTGNPSKWIKWSQQ